MDPSPRTAKRRKLGYSTSNGVQTPSKDNPTPSRKSSSRKRSTRSGGHENISEKVAEFDIGQADTEARRRFSDAVAEYQYNDGPSKKKDDNSEEKSQELVDEGILDPDPDPETPSRRGRGARAFSKTTTTPQRRKSARPLQQLNESSQLEDSSAQIIAEDGAISGLGNGVNGHLSPPSILSRRKQQDDSHTADDGNTLQIDGNEVADEDGQPRSSGRQRRKSQKILEQEAVQPTLVKKGTPRKLRGLKHGASKVKSSQDALLEESRIQVTTELEDAATKAQNERIGQSVTKSVTKSSQRSKKQRGSPDRRLNTDGQEVESSGSKLTKANEQQANDVNRDAYVGEEDEPVQVEDEIEPVLPLPAPVHVEQSEDTTAIETTPTASIEASNSQITLLQRVLVERLTGHRPIPLTNLDDEYTKIHNLVSQTVTAGEGNSMLVIGARGSGKTALVNAVVSDLAKDHKDDFHIIRLNGFIQTDDKLALREIWRQLGREMEVEDEGDAVGKNYADTLATLLVLLSHPSELAGQETDAVAKSVVFVMDEFDLFATHPRQTLLYNLFDIAQSRKAPIAVLGLTTRLDVAEGLEKRVKSRWSHRYVHVPLSKSLVAFQQLVRAALAVKTDQLNFDERAMLAGPAVKESSANKKKKKSKVEEPSQDILTAWNSCVDSLLQHSTFSTHLSRTYTLSKSLPTLLTSLLPALTSLHTSPTFPPPPSFFVASSPSSSSHLPPLAPPDSPLHLLPALSTLALALLIAAARLEIIHVTESANFNLAYAEYISLASKARVQQTAQGALAYSGGAGGEARVWGRRVAWGEWEGLVRCGLLVPVLGGGGSGSGSGGFVGEVRVKDGTEMVRCDVGLEEIGLAVPEMGSVLMRWCKEI